MQDKNPKEYFQQIFKEAVQEIKDNRNHLGKVIACTRCGAKNLGISKHCNICGKIIRYEIESIFKASV
ncbi:hypothetical protein LCGC14_0558940 [marine sediment metagenome]|uniref:Uncharacterized protein n=1 Tax=marine sediment metagenome TaxID=412755 RepID=A0A0F9S6D0_9ZZZZ|nr:MAG: hypothetical protein Lokiarch_02480 [Candidatus Lokiarchaeum sp. GC14_75]